MTLSVPSVLAALVATGVAAGLTPLVRHVAHWMGAVDAPGGRRAHTQATPRLGGLAIMGGYWSALVLCFGTGLLDGHVLDQRAVWIFLLGGALIALTGAFDDVKPLGAKKKLVAQFVVASLAWYGDVRITEHVAVPGFGLIEIGPWLSYFGTVIWILAITNAINLIDGLDGLAGGVVFFAGLTNLVVAVVSGNLFAATLNAALAGAVLGFLFYNFNPATIFMGDTGSMFLGYTLGSAALLSNHQKESTLVSLLVPIIALGLPLTDTLLAMARRFLSHRSIFSADRQHLHHRLVDLGLTHRRAVLVLYACSVLLCAAATAAAFGKDWQVGAALCGALLTLLGVTRFTSHFEFVLLAQTRRARALAGSAASLRKVLPDLIVELDRARSTPAVWAALETAFASSGLITASRVVPAGETQPSWHWEAEVASQRREGVVTDVDFALAVYPGARKARLNISCICEEGALPPQTEIQLQLAADAVQAALMRLNVENPRQLIHEVGSKAAQQA